MIQNKLKEAYPTPLQLRNATKELQNNMEISNEVYIDINWDMSQDYTSPDKSIVYTASNKTITFNMDIGLKLNCLNYVYLNITSNFTGVTLEFYSKNNSYNFYCLFVADTTKLISTFNLVQEDEKSYYIYDNYITSNIDSFTTGFISFNIVSNHVAILIKNIYLGKVKNIPYLDNNYINLNEIKFTNFSTAI